MTSWLNERFAHLLMRKFGGGDESFYKELMASAREGHLCLIKQAPVSLPPGVCYEGDALCPLEPIIRWRDRYYLQRNWVCETTLCKEASRLAASQTQNASPILPRGPLNEAQIAAIQQAATHQWTIISGGPGTGKTYTAGQMIRALCSDVKRLYKVCLTAPTGRAAQHLQSSLSSLEAPLSLQVDTLHRVLGLVPGKSKLFTPSLIDADFVVVDEASMIDVDLWAHLLGAIGEQTKLIVMGDPDQLPPVESGSIFSDFADLFAVRLHQCMRTDRKELQELASAIRLGDYESTLATLQAGLGSFSPIDPKTLYEELSLSLFSREPDPRDCLSHFQQVKILGALRQGPLGVDRLNALFWEFFQATFRKGHYWAAPILICSNAPHLQLYNGSLGVLIGSCGQRSSEAAAYFLDSLSGEIRSFPPAILPHYEWAFCLSVHKSQGGEFDRVIALFPEGSERFGREALYTAATRSKKSLTMMIRPEVLKAMLGQRFRRQSSVIDRMGKSGCI